MATFRPFQTPFRDIMWLCEKKNKNKKPPARPNFFQKKDAKQFFLFYLALYSKPTTVIDLTFCGSASRKGEQVRYYALGTFAARIVGPQTVVRLV